MTRIAILGNYATQFLNKSVKKVFKEFGQDVLIYEADFGTIDFEILNSDSVLFEFKPDYIILHESDLAFKNEFYHLGDNEKQFFFESKSQNLLNRLNILQENLPKCKVFYPMLLSSNDMVFGNYFSKVKTSWFYQVVKYNNALLDLSNDQANFLAIDGISQVPANLKLRSRSLVYTSDLHFTIDYLNYLAGVFHQIINVNSGKFKKCVILDLDNTLWGGIIGDDGLEGIELGSNGVGKAYSDLQKWFKQLQQRGIILAVCSKNEEAIAKTPFERHPNMVLKLDDISVFVANWNSKADNINYIREVLNIGLDSMVFIDDNPAERAIVKEFLPEVFVPDLPNDASEYLDYLMRLNLFETASVSENDKLRTLQYHQESKRVELQKSVTNMTDFLISLEMKAKVTSFQVEDYERLSQLSLRSNQFNLRTKRYSLDDIKSISESDKYLTVSISLKDKFGDYGLISMVIVEIDKQNEVAFIDTWIMSCRVLKRNVEDLALNHVLYQLKQLGIKNINGEYIPTEKNRIVAELLFNFGFERLENESYKFVLEVASYTNREIYIENDN